MQIEVIKDLDEIKLLKSKWDELFDLAQPGLFVHSTWVYENYRCFKDQDILLLAVFGEKKKLIGVFPFSIKPFQIKFLKYKALVHGGSQVTDYSQFIIDPEANSRLMIKRVIEKLLEIQPGNWDVFKLDNLSDGDDLSNLFMNLSLRTLYSGSTSTEVTPIIKYNNGHEEAKKVANIQRRFKKVTHDCTVDYIVGSDISSEMLYEFSQLHRKAYPNSGFETEQAQRFYKALIDDQSFSHYVHLSHIYHEGRLIAAHFGFVDLKTFYYYVPTYDEAYALYGPGQYLLWKLIRLANEKGLAEFDFLRGSENYKFNWTNKINTNYTVFGVPPNAGVFMRLLVNLWLITKSIPFFKQIYPQ